MKIGYVSQWFPPEPAGLSLDIATGLAERGHDVTVFTGYPNYPHGRIYPGYSQRGVSHETLGCLAVVRSPLYPSHGESIAGRMVNYASFVVSTTATLQLSKEAPDIWLSYSSPALAGLPAMLSPRARKRPRALLIQDLWPDSVLQSDLLPKVAATAVSACLGPPSARSYRDAAAIGIISPGARAVLESRGVDPAKIHYTPNWADDANLYPERETTPELKQSLGLPKDQMLFMYAGNFGDYQALHELMDGFAAVPEAALVLIGDGALEGALRGRVAAEALQNVSFVARQTPNKIGEYLAAADVQIVSLADRPLMYYTMPSKVQTSLAAGRPILAHAPGDAAAVVRKSKSGLATNPGDKQSLATVIRKFVSMPSSERLTLGKNARQAFNSGYSRKAGLDRIETMLESALLDYVDRHDA